MTALYIDISGKQEYIFQSNRLKINIGASYIMAHEITEIQVIKSLNAIEKDTHWTVENLNDWRKDGDNVNRIIFIGGGSALLCFDEKENAIAFNTHYSTAILKKYPGIYVNLTLKEDFDVNNFQAEFSAIKRKQKEERNQHDNYNDPFMFGLEEEDTILGKPVTHLSPVLKDRSAAKQEVSLEVSTKIKAAKASEIAFKTLLTPSDSANTISNEMDEIATDDENGYIAVVHVDGNGFGKKFQSLKTLSEFRKTSTQLEENLNEVLKNVFQTLESEIDSGEISINESTFISCFKSDEEEKFVVPFRPIINAGDDITFVCHGRLGFYLAELYLKEMKEVGMYACAGVAIVHNKFPFYKAYQLAEDLCEQGKKASRKISTASSWIQFFRATGSFSGDLDTILNRQFHNKFKTKPYLVTNEGTPSIPAGQGELIEDFYKISEQLDNWNNNKVMQLRDALKNNVALKTFFAIEEVKAEKNQMPAQHQVQPSILFDAIEMRGFILKNNAND